MLGQIEKFHSYRMIVFHEFNGYSRRDSHSRQIIGYQHFPSLVITDTKADSRHIMIETELRLPGSFPIRLSLGYRHKTWIMFHLQRVMGEHFFPETL